MIWRNEKQLANKARIIAKVCTISLAEAHLAIGDWLVILFTGTAGDISLIIIIVSITVAFVFKVYLN